MAARSQMALHLVALVLLLCAKQIFSQIENPIINGNKPDDEESLSLEPKSNLNERCIRDNGQEGLCVYDYQCSQNYSLAIGGDIKIFEIRAGGALLRNCGPRLWCCTNDTAQTWVPTATSVPVTTMTRQSNTETADCLRVYDDDCPWCVGLYRPGGDVSRGHRLASGLYCAGALIGSRVVLTSATCLHTVANEAIWASVPASAFPKRHYSVINKILHENYNSGSHANDFGLMVLNEDVQWNGVPGGQTRGACLGLQTPLEGDCLAAGFNKLEEVVTISVLVRREGCTSRRRTKLSNRDFACGTADAAACPIVPGAPVLCPTTSAGKGDVIAGVVRQHCIESSVKIGKLQMHAEWLKLQLRRLGVQPLQYSG